MRALIFTLLVCFFTSSCAFHSGMMTGNAAISDSNFQYVALAKGTATTTHFLGIGGLKKDALMFEAKKDLLRRYPLRKGQALANVTVDVKRTFVFIVMKTRATVTADVIDFNPSDISTDFAQINASHRLDDLNHALIGCNTTDSVLFAHDKSYTKGLILGFYSNYVKLRYSTAPGVEFVKNASNDDVLVIKKQSSNVKNFGFEVGDKVKFLSSNGQIKEGVVFGLHKSHIGVKYSFDSQGKFKWKLLPPQALIKLN